MQIEIGPGIQIGKGINFTAEIVVVDITTQDNDQLITESGDNITTEQF